jgi:uncharacterized phage protein gp47/JayE
LRKAVIKVIGKTIGAIAHLVYGYIENVTKELLVSTCVTLEYLQIHGKENNVPRKAATFASGLVQFEGLSGSVIPEDTLCQGDNGVQYKITAAVTIGSSLNAICNVVSLESGIKGNAAAGSAISLTSEIVGVTSAGVVETGGIQGGTDIESFNSWKNRILKKKQRISMGGSEDDWISWVKDCPSITPTRVWAIPRISGVNTVGILFVFDDRTNIVPTETDIETMTNWLETVRPIKTTPILTPVVLKQVSFTIRSNPLTAILITNIEKALKDLFITVAMVNEKILISDIRESISFAAGSADTEVYAIFVDGISVPINDINGGDGKLAVFDTNNTTYELRP